MRTLTGLLGVCLVLAAGGCEEDLADSEQLELRLGGEPRSINCQVFFEDANFYTVAFYWQGGVFTLTVSWDHVLVHEVEAVHIDHAGLRLIEPEFEQSRSSDMQGSLVWLQTFAEARKEFHFWGNANDIRVVFTLPDSTELPIDLSGTFSLVPPGNLDITECLTGD